MSQQSNPKSIERASSDANIANLSPLSLRLTASILRAWTLLPAKLNLKIQPSIIDYPKAASEEQTATGLFNIAISCILLIQNIISKSATAKLEAAIKDQITLAVFGSNFVEQVGLPRNETIQLYQLVFSNNVSFDISTPSEYHARLENILQNTDELLRDTELRDRREVINHAGAFIYMADRVVNHSESFSEKLIRDTHKILVWGIDAIHHNAPATPYKQYGGFYRSVHVAAGNCNFINPKFVGVAMKRFVEDLKNKLAAAENAGALDPFFFAADACGEFVNIHPFLDGNGRTCRLILNTILLKYAGIVAPIGEQGEERKNYLEIAKRRGEDECGNGELALYTLGESHQMLKSVKDKVH
ncbi:hypothetical protein TWF694_002708 [Orbilia ellipsospora]|uniref:Fido domain-containing protein n=1 Tax=Orbilia ellipsospora TaxID=2528407 RepID=A0AAV9X403_9PEZI